MLEFMGKHYYLDVDKIIEICRPLAGEETEQNGDDNGKKQIELNVFKFECYKSCVDRLLTEYQTEDEDDAMAAFTNKTTNVSFSIAFNTLVKNEILIEDE